MRARLAQLLRTTLKRGGSVLLPSFAVGRAQALRLVLQRLRRAGELPLDVPIWLDSPMAEQATELTLRHARLLRISVDEARGLTDRVHVTRDHAEVKVDTGLHERLRDGSEACHQPVLCVGHRTGVVDD